MVFKRTVVRSNLHRAICHSFNSFYSCCFRENWLTPYSPTTSWSLFRISSEKLSVWCFLFVTLFNLQGTRRIRRNIAILPNFIPFVKSFFQKFFDVRSVQYRSNFFSLTPTDQFVKYFFQSFLTNFSVVFAAGASAPTALLEYHPTSHLSTLFLHLFSLF